MNLIEIHLNNSDLTVANLSAIAGIAQDEVLAILQAHYRKGGHTLPNHYLK